MNAHIWPTERQLQILKLIRDAEYTPSTREICAAFGFSSTNAAADHLRRLHQKGFVTLVPKQARSVRLTPAGRRMLTIGSQVHR